MPVAHRSSAAILLGGGRAENQVSLDEALAALKPLLTDRSVLKIGHNLKYDWLLCTGSASTSRPSTTRC